MLETKMKSVPPSFKVCAETKIQETLVVCTVGCEWQNPLSKLQQRLQTLLCNLLRITNTACKRNEVKHKTYLRRKVRLYGAALFLRVSQVIGILISCRARDNELTQSEKVSLFSCAVLNALQVFFFSPNLQCDQPMPVRSTGIIMWNKGFNSHHDGPWKKYMKQNRMETKLQIKRGKFQPRPVLASVPTAGLLQQKWLLANLLPALLPPLSPWNPLGVFCFKYTPRCSISGAWSWSQTLCTMD